MIIVKNQIENITLKELGLKLKDMYYNAKKGESVAMIHLY